MMKGIEMKKTIKNDKIRNPKSRNELKDLYLYGLLYEAELSINPVDILIFFNKEYKYNNLTEKEADRLSNDLKKMITKFRMIIAGNSLSARGYESEEF